MIFFGFIPVAECVCVLLFFDAFVCVCVCARCSVFDLSDFVLVGVCLCAYLVILASLIRMPLAGSCPNRGCHLIKSIICWLSLLELRRKRSVPTLFHSIHSRSLSRSPSPTHPFTHPLALSWGKKLTITHINQWLIQANRPEKCPPQLSIGPPA